MERNFTASKLTIESEERSDNLSSRTSLALFAATVGTVALGLALKRQQFVVKGLESCAEAAGKGSKAIVEDSTSFLQEAISNTTTQAQSLNKDLRHLPVSGRSAADQEKFDLAERIRTGAYRDASLDSSVSEAAQKAREDLTRSGQTLRNPVTGEILDKNHTFYKLYMDNLPRRESLEFAESGHLKPGIYKMSVDEFANDFAGSRRRESLLANFEEVLKELRTSGVKQVHVGGSFVTRKPHPGDIDFTWNKHEFVHDNTALASYRRGVLLEHDSPELHQLGLQMLVDPPSGGTHDGILYFLAHGRVEWQARIRGAWRTTGTNIPKGLVEIDLTSMPKRWLEEVAKVA